MKMLSHEEALIEQRDMVLSREWWVIPVLTTVTARIIGEVLDLLPDNRRDDVRGISRYGNMVIFVRKLAVPAVAINAVLDRWSSTKEGAAGPRDIIVTGIRSEDEASRAVEMVMDWLQSLRLDGEDDDA